MLLTATHTRVEINHQEWEQWFANSPEWKKLILPFDGAYVKLGERSKCVDANLEDRDGYKCTLLYPTDAFEVDKAWIPAAWLKTRPRQGKLW